MTRQISRPAYILILAALLGLVAGTLGADKLDFSGSYTLKKTSGAAKPAKGEVWVLRVSQTESAIEVTRVLNGHQYVNKFPLDGSEGTYVSPGGPTGTCKGQLKTKYLTLRLIRHIPSTAQWSRRSNAYKRTLGTFVRFKRP